MINSEKNCILTVDGKEIKATTSFSEEEIKPINEWSLRRKTIEGIKEVGIYISGCPEVDYIVCNGVRYEKPQNQPDE